MGAILLKGDITIGSKVKNDRGKSVVASMLPSKIMFDKRQKTKSATNDFSDWWHNGKQTVFDIEVATFDLIKRSVDKVIKIYYG